MRLFQFLTVFLLGFISVNVALADLQQTTSPFQQREMLYQMFSPFDAGSTPELSNSQASTESKTAKQPISSSKKLAKKPLAHKKQFKKKQSAPDKVYTIMETLTPEKRSALEKRLQAESRIEETPFGISFYQPTYILPVYYTSSPYGVIYRGITPDNQQVMPLEFKAQLSLKFPIVRHLMGKYSSVNIGYTQLSYWQFYARSQYFRETNYEPALFWTDRIAPNWWINLGVEHQSNGRGGATERSWNRAFANLMISGKHWMISFKPWLLIFKRHTSDVHNPDIADYLGHGKTTLVYSFHRNVFSLMLRNNIESRFRHGAIEFDYNFPIYGHLSGYTQFFAGYGQSLIEYNHSTKAVGIGIALSNWI